MSKPKPKPKAKRKKKTAVHPKHIIVNTPLKIHLPHEFIARPIDWQVGTHVPAIRTTPAVPEPEPIKIEAASPWWKFWE